MTFNKSLLIPLIIFAVLVLFLALGFRLQDPRLLPSVLINKPFPDFELRDLTEPELVRGVADITGEVSLVNVWATWCPNCLIEHPELLRISRETSVPVYGINYNDDNLKAIRWLKRHEDPYDFSVIDGKGTLAINLGVYGAPETFVLDRNGVIRFRHVGPVTPKIWSETLLPVVEHLQGISDG